MRRMLKWLAILMAALLPVWAVAQSQSDFALSCTVKTTREAALYTAEYSEDETGAVTAAYTQTATLEANTPVRLTGAKDEERGLRECWYYQDGAAHKAWVDAEALASATVTIYLDDGSTLLLTEALASDEAALAAYFSERYPGRKYGLNPLPTPMPAPTPTPAPIVPDAWVSAEESAMAEVSIGVKVLSLGLTESAVMDQMYDEFTIPTDQLIFADGVDAAHRIAVIHAPRSGSAALRDKSSTSGKKLESCMTGRIVPVLEYGEDFSLVRYEGTEGYVLTDALTFFTGGQTPLGEGTLHLKGKTDGRDEVNIRTTASASSARVASWQTGLTVTVLSHEGLWYAVEHEGWYGFVHQQYLTMEGE